MNWLNLLQTQLKTSRHFIHGKTFKEQLLGYFTIKLNIRLLAKHDNYTSQELQKARQLLKEFFPAELPPPNPTGEIFMTCASYVEAFGSNMPMVTPLNPDFREIGSISGLEKYAQKHYQTVFEQTRTRTENKSEFSIFNSFIIHREKIFNNNSTDKVTAAVYKVFQNANTTLSAGYFMLDLEEYKLIKGCYPEDISKLSQAGFTTQLPNNPDSDGKIIYSNDGKQATLYAVGKDSKDDSDDIIYWQRNLK
ncbi:MAG: hypothetical protein LLF92_00635 [Planctomycetaceae bacterium]|nr:hypothetical protein [Planctomycetaceae bacterium]